MYLCMLDEYSESLILQSLRNLFEKKSYHYLFLELFHGLLVVLCEPLVELLQRHPLPLAKAGLQDAHNPLLLLLDPLLARDLEQLHLGLQLREQPRLLSYLFLK